MRTYPFVEYERPLATDSRKRAAAAGRSATAAMGGNKRRASAIPGRTVTPTRNSFLSLVNSCGRLPKMVDSADDLNSCGKSATVQPADVSEFVPPAVDNSVVHPRRAKHLLCGLLSTGPDCRIAAVKFTRQVLKQHSKRSQTLHMEAVPITERQVPARRLRRTIARWRAVTLSKSCDGELQTVSLS